MSYDVLLCKKVPLEGRSVTAPHLGDQFVQKLPFCGVNGQFQAKLVKYRNPDDMYTWTSPDGNTRNQIDYISITQRWKTSLMNCRTYPGADCDTDHQLLVATVKVRLAKRQR